MLTTSAGFADLEQLSLLAVGSSTIHAAHAVPLQTILALYAGSFASNNGIVAGDLPERVVQEAIGLEAEAAADRFIRQVSTYEQLSQTGQDPLWTAVTGYYAAFFAANALLLGIGRGMVSVSSASLPVVAAGGLHQISVCAGSSVGQLRIELRSASGPGSHRATWSALRSLVDELAATTGNGAREAQTFTALGALIVGPDWLSKERNVINYDFLRNPFLAGFWSRELSGLVDEEALASRILSIVTPRPEQRFELVSAACGSMFFALSRRFLARGGRLDPFRRTARQSTLAACPSLAWLVA